MSALAAHRRKLRKGQAEEEDASKLKLGEDFQDAQCLSISDVALLLSQKRGEKVRDVGEHSLTELFSKTHEYVQSFARFKTADSVREAGRLIDAAEGAEFASFERAQLMNLCPDEAEEAKTLIPSLQRTHDETIQRLLDEMMTLRKFQT